MSKRGDSVTSDIVGVGGHLRTLLGFSRVLQATLSVAQPVLAAVVALHGFPPSGRLVLGLTVAWAGFLAVFALNDLLDADLDRIRFAHLRGFEGFDVDSTISRHPLAQRQLTPRSGRIWIVGLALFALGGAYLLSPLAAGLFLLAGTLEFSYCRLARVSALKFLNSGAMVGVGALAGWVAMTQQIRLPEMAVIFLWMFTWEIGGRNIVNDFADVEEDSRLSIKTVPLVYGPRFAALLIFCFLIVATLAPLVLEPLGRPSLPCMVGLVAMGLYLLIRPGIRLLRHPVPETALALFNVASFYPPAALAVIIACLGLPY